MPGSCSHMDIIINSLVQKWPVNVALRSKYGRGVLRMELDMTSQWHACHFIRLSYLLLRQVPWLGCISPPEKTACAASSGTMILGVCFGAEVVRLDDACLSSGVARHHDKAVSLLFVPGQDLCTVISICKNLNGPVFALSNWLKVVAWRVVKMSGVERVAMSRGLYASWE